MEIVTKVMEKSWKSHGKFVGKNVYEPCRGLNVFLNAYLKTIANKYTKIYIGRKYII